MAVVALYAAFRIPYDLALGYAGEGQIAVYDALMLTVLLADPVIGYFFSKRRGVQGLEHFLGQVLPIDIMAALALVAFDVDSPVRLLALVKAVQVTVFVSAWRHQLLQKGNLLRLLLFLYWLVILIHLAACGWIILRFNPSVGHRPYEYLEAAYWSVSTLATIGYGDIVPQTPTEMLYAIVVMLIGFVMMGYLIGNISGLLNSPNPLRAQYVGVLEEVTAFANYHSLPPSLRHRLVDYYGYMWQQHAAYNESSLLGSLPSGLRSEVMIHLKRDVIKAVPFFHSASDSFIREIANVMHPMVVTPGEFVFRVGDPATEMYFVSHGTLTVQNEHGDAITTFKDGDAFGDAALVEKSRRKIAVLSTTYSDLYVLKSEDFDKIMENHVDFRSYMEQVAQERSGAIDRHNSAVSNSPD